ncbi:NAD-dependent epimerase/dehydratase family protein [Pedobacter gandavensis]|uniref:NAD-dependent epimerase/dehydratase family protein n=1 Tax=Pedobacter gandavensis TaxID=2679963 RepID=A0ABR6ESM2_9SPHI|nr:NAD(P)-dependent oxidoreductase [Pedobacter gandavensis]MBB2148265.1 NAD-dependent epimerase/dehydratase family protein [Pedobacter gandavensis]
MRVLVTGSSGRLGSVTVEHLKNSGHQVIGIDLIKHPSTDHLIDIQNKEDVGNILQGVDFIVHTAALHGKHYDLNYSREALIEVNIKGTLNLLNAAVKNGIKKFLYLSTTSIYGTAMQDEKQAVWVDETLTEQPRDIYDITKQCCEQLCKDFFYREGLATTVFRVARFLPESENLTINHRLYRGLDERDGAEAIRLALLHNFDQFEIFNISSGTPFRKEDLALLKHSPLEAILKYFPEAEEIYRKNNWIFPKTIDRVYVSEKAKAVLGYQPKYTFDYLLHQ